MADTTTLTHQVGARSAGAPRGALAVLAVAQLVLALDYSIVNVALPSIGSSLRFSQNGLEWVISAYALTFGGFLLLGGRAADLLGRRRMFMYSAALFAVASAVGGVAASAGMLVASRAVQGLAGAFLFPATLSLVTTIFPEGHERNRAVSVWGSAGASGLAVGVFVGGVLTTALGWRWVFYVNVPVVAALLLLAPVVLPARRPPRQPLRRFDLPGALAVTAGSILVVLGLVEASELGWGSAEALLAGAAGLIMLGVFVLIELRSEAPLMPVALLKNRHLWGGVLVTASFMASFGMQFFFLTLYLERAVGDSPIVAGLIFLPLAALNVLGNRVGGRLASRYGLGWVLPGGLVVGALGMALYVRLGTGGSLGALLLAEAIAGFGQGVTFTTAYLAAGSGVPGARQGVASGMASTAQQVGGSIGLALLVDLLSARLGVGGGGIAAAGASAGLLLPALRWVFVAQAGIALGAAVVAAKVLAKSRAVRAGVQEQ